MKIDFTEGNIEKKLLSFSIPILLGVMFHTVYNIVDTIFVGMLGPNELAAVSITFPVLFIFIAFASGLEVGANVLISQAIGKKNIPEASNLAEHGLAIGLVVGVFLSLFCILFSPFIFEFMGADSVVLPMAITYSVPIFIGLIFMFLWFVSDAILRAQGDSKTPLKIMIISGVINLILDPLLIFGLFGFPEFGLVGAAYATVFARVIGAILMFMVILKPDAKIPLALKNFKPHPEYLKNIFMVGMPAAFSQLFTSLGLILLTGIVGSFGSLAIAAFGIVQKLNMVVIMPFIGISSALATFVGQNIGAKKPERIKKAFNFSLKLAFGFAVLFAIIVLFYSELFIRVFTADLEVIRIGSEYLSIAIFAYLGYSITFIIRGVFQGAGKTNIALLTNLLSWVIVVLFAFYLSGIMGLFGIWVAVVAGAIAEVIFSSWIYLSKKWLPIQTS